MKHILASVLFGVLVAAPAAQAQERHSYRARLSPMPVAAFTPTVVGSGSATATVTKAKLVIAGTFTGLDSPATVARLCRSDKPGMRGAPLIDLAVSGDTSGTIAGELELTPAQVEELQQGRYYVQLHSEKAAEGNLWGWLLPEPTTAEKRAQGK